VNENDQLTGEEQTGTENRIAEMRPRLSSAQLRELDARLASDDNTLSELQIVTALSVWMDVDDYAAQVEKIANRNEVKR